MATKKWISPLEMMTREVDHHIPTVDETTQEILTGKLSLAMPPLTRILLNEGENIPQIIQIDPSDCIKWKYKDRPENELGDIEELADNMQKYGQIHPVTGRKLPPSAPEYPTKKYELITGERRWMAAKKANIKLLAIIKDLSDYEAALIQASENDKRKDLSDYAKGIMLYQQIEDGILTAKDLEVKLNRSQSYVRNLLSFSRLDKEILHAIGDMRNISARTAYELVRWQEKGETYKQAIISLAPLLKTEKVGEKTLESHIHKILQKKPFFKQRKEVIAIDGRHLFSWRHDSNQNPSISFPKAIRNSIDFGELEKALISHLEQQLKKKSAEI